MRIIIDEPQVGFIVCVGVEARVHQVRGDAGLVVDDEALPVPHNRVVVRFEEHFFWNLREFRIAAKAQKGHVP